METIPSMLDGNTSSILSETMFLSILIFLTIIVFSLFAFIIKLLSDKHKLIMTIKEITDDKVSSKADDNKNLYELIQLYNTSNTNTVKSLDNINRVLQSIQNNRT